ncbi:MAG: hypothetical protein O7D33_08125 [Chloroflexi bacterium]|nr:hypothetical protein [Chloroflexota bacterium]
MNRWDHRGTWRQQRARLWQERIGRYGILGRIAAGGQATVYRAWDSESGQVVALKVLHPHLTHDANYIKRFQLEARLSLNITHPNVQGADPVFYAGVFHVPVRDL